MKKSIFYCSSCGLKFENFGFKVFWQDKIYGACWKRSAICPKCKKQVDEYFPKNKQQKNLSKGVVPSCSCGDGSCYH